MQVLASFADCDVSHVDRFLPILDGGVGEVGRRATQRVLREGEARHHR